ncbi:MAG TPA: hypothetical protein VFR32_10945 [Gaiellaceae bacterium]|nr:hypothetical protein [Gaiellaceae bacterium]
MDGPGVRRLAALLGLAAVATLSVVTAIALAGRSERPASQVDSFVVDLQAAAKLAEQAKSSTGWLAANNAKRCAQVEPAAAKLAAAADAAKAVFERYRKTKSRYGLQEEIRLITEIALDLRESRGSLAKVAGESYTPSNAEEKAALKEVGIFRQLVALELEDRLEIEGLADVLTARSLREVKDKVVSELQTRLRERAEQELKRLTGLSIRLNVPLKEQIKDFLRAELSRFLSRLVVSAGPAGIIISIVGGKIFDPGRLVDLIGAKLKAALREKGNLDARTAKTLAGFERMRRSLNALPPNAPIDRVRAVVRDSERALKATKFLIGDLERAKRNDLKLDLEDAEADLKRTLSLSKRRFLLDSALLGEDFGLGVAAMKNFRAEAERLSKKLGCDPPPKETGGGSGGAADKGKPPTASVCVPKTIRIEYFSSLGAKLGEYDAPFSKLVRVYPADPYYYKCLWVTQPGGATEAFVIFIEIIPAGTPGRISSGNCTGNRPDSPPFYHSRKRQLTVSGGNRALFQNAVGGNAKILRGVLAAAEAQGVGPACPAR